MVLLDEKDRAKLAEYPLYSQSEKRGGAKVILKYFLTGTGATWYVLEGSPEEYVGEDGKPYEDFTFFGYVEGITEGGDEYGYFTLKQLEEIEIKVPVIDGSTGKQIGTIPARVEKDLYLREGVTIGELVPTLWKEDED